MRYIEFDSTYRNRNLYPLTSVFEINISQSGTKNKFEALDPVANASPSLVWNNTFQEGKAANYISGIVVSPVSLPQPTTTGTCIFQITTSPAYGGSDENLRQVRTFYLGCNLTRASDGNYPGTAPITCRRIIDYWPLDNKNALIQVEYSIPDSLVGLGGWYIQNPTPLDTSTPNSIIKTWIPGSNSGFEDVQRFQSYGTGGDNYYINYYIENTDTGTSIYIIAFDSITRLATLDAPTINTNTSPPTNENWAVDIANFAIRLESPAEFGTIQYSYNNIIQIINQDLSLNGENFEFKTGLYDGDFLRIRPAENTFPPWIPPVNEERRICKFVNGSGGFSALYGPGPYTGACLDLNAPEKQDAYKNCILTLFRISVGNMDLTTNSHSTLITYYGIGNTPATSSCKKYAEFLDPLPAITTIGVDYWIVRTVILCDPFSQAPLEDAFYELETYTRDNAVPFNWTGSLITTSEVVCYEVELINLILPNVLLASGRGGRLIFYPFLYVELSQVSATSGSSGTRGILSSNNPNAFRMLYRAILSDTPQPASSPFIKIDGDSMVHTIKFKPTDNFKFGVYHASGEPIKFVLDEQLSPTEANALIQISACFSFKRV